MFLYLIVDTIYKLPNLFENTYYVSKGIELLFDITDINVENEFDYRIGNNALNGIIFSLQNELS